MEPLDDFRKCHRCGELKAIDEFSWRRKARGQRDSFCRPCRSAYGKEHYAANRQRYIDQARVQKQRLALERTRYLIEYFAAHPCIDCGEADPWCSSSTISETNASISDRRSRSKLASILAKIEKCEVVCANCHRRRTARGAALRAILTQVDPDPGVG